MAGTDTVLEAIPTVIAGGIALSALDMATRPMKKKRKHKKGSKSRRHNFGV